MDNISGAFQNKKKAYLSQKMIDLINSLIAAELNAHQLYKSMITWANYTGYTGLEKFLEHHNPEEKMHMNKLITYMLDRQVNPITPAQKQQPTSYRDLKDVLEKSLAHEELIENKYKEAVRIALSENDHTSYNLFLWYLNEQVEEIALFSTWLDRLTVVGADTKGMFFIDAELGESVD